MSGLTVWINLQKPEIPCRIGMQGDGSLFWNSPDETQFARLKVEGVIYRAGRDGDWMHA